MARLQREIAAHDRMSRLVVLIAVLAGVAASVEGDLGRSAAASLALTSAAAVAYLRIRREIIDDRVAGWVGVPFSLLLGWTSIVSAAWILAAAGVVNPAPAVTLIVFVAGTAMYLALHLRDVGLQLLRGVRRLAARHDQREGSARAADRGERAARRGAVLGRRDRDRGDGVQPVSTGFFAFSQPAIPSGMT